MEGIAGTLWLSPSRLEIALDCLYRWNALYGQKRTPWPHPDNAAPVGGPQSEQSAETEGVYGDLGNLNGHAVEGAVNGQSHSEGEGLPTHNPGLAVGIAAHAVLARLFAPVTKHGKARIAPDSPDWHAYLQSLVVACLPSQAESGGHDEQQVTDAVFNIIRCAYPKLRPTGKVLGVETYLSCTTMIGGYHAHLTCRPDRLELQEDGTLHVIDYKANSNGNVLSPRLLAAHLPSYLYFLVPWQHYRKHPLIRNVVVSQVNLLSLRTSVAEYDQAQIIENREALRCCVEALANGPYDPTPGPACRWCPLRAACPAWQDAELDLSALDDFDDWRHRD